ncbi:hypothetical protein KCP74_11815 [Salmonella enterica subsp. enterica]|nr:hypothetical protein KCP74_11815 [Salmonella enterica subsp. enterica]
MLPVKPHIPLIPSRPDSQRSDVITPSNWWLAACHAVLPDNLVASAAC